MLIPGITASTLYSDPSSGGDGVTGVLDDLLSGSSGVVGGSGDEEDDYYQVYTVESPLDLWPSLGTKVTHSVNAGNNLGGGTFCFGFTYMDRYSWASLSQQILDTPSPAVDDILSIRYWSQSHFSNNTKFELQTALSVSGYTDTGIFTGVGTPGTFCVIVTGDVDDTSVTMFVNGNPLTSGELSSGSWFQNSTLLGDGGSTHPDAIIHYYCYSRYVMSSDQRLALEAATQTEYGV